MGYGDDSKPVAFTRETIRKAMRKIAAEPPRFRRDTWTGEMVIAALYMQEDLGAVNVLCGPTLYAEIRRLQSMTLAERIAEREAVN